MSQSSCSLSLAMAALTMTVSRLRCGGNSSWGVRVSSSASHINAGGLGGSSSEESPGSGSGGPSASVYLQRDSASGARCLFPGTCTSLRSVPGFPESTYSWGMKSWHLGCSTSLWYKRHPLPLSAWELLPNRGYNVWGPWTVHRVRVWTAHIWWLSLPEGANHILLVLSDPSHPTEITQNRSHGCWCPLTESQVVCNYSQWVWGQGLNWQVPSTSGMLPPEPLPRQTPNPFVWGGLRV